MPAPRSDRGREPPPTEGAADTAVPCRSRLLPATFTQPSAALKEDSPPGGLSQSTRRHRLEQLQWGQFGRGAERSRTPISIHHWSIPPDISQIGAKCEICRSLESPCADNDELIVAGEFTPRASDVPGTGG